MKSLGLFGSFNRTVGYGIYSFNLAQALNRLLPVSLFPTTRDENLPSSFQRMLARSQLGEFPKVALSIAYPSDIPYFHAPKRAFITMWEGSILSYRMIRYLQEVDVIFATSQWMKKVYINSGIPEEKIAVAMGGVDTQLFTPPNPQERMALIEKDKPFRFLTVGKYERRKASREIIQAFLKAFGPEDNVILECKFISPATIPLVKIKEDLAPLFNTADKKVVAKIKFVDSASSLVGLYRRADCFLLPSCAEGVGLPLLEAMACGKPAITTPYSAHGEYFSSDCGVLLPDRGQVPAIDTTYGIHPQSHGTWGAVIPEDISQAMRQIYQTDEQTRLSLGKKAREHVEKYSWEKMAQRVIQELEARFQ